MVKKKRVRRIRSPIKQKVLLLLAAGIALSASRSLGRQLYVFRKLDRAWKNIDRQYLYRILREFKEERLINYQEKPDGTVEIVLSEKGRERVVIFNLDTMTIPELKDWDGKWRVVIYDIPEKKKSARETLRHKLKELGFHEWQKSVFIHPYPCRDQIDLLMEIFDIRTYVRYGEITNISNEAELKLRFDLV